MSTDDTPPRAAFLARLDTAVTLLWDANRDDSEDAARPNDPEVDVWTAAANLSNTLRKYGDVVRDEVWDLLVPSADAVELHPTTAPPALASDPCGDTETACPHCGDCACTRCRRDAQVHAATYGAAEKGDEDDDAVPAGPHLTDAQQAWITKVAPAWFSAPIGLHSHAALIALQQQRIDALSRLLRGMARRVAQFRETASVLADPDAVDAIRQGQQGDAGTGVDLRSLAAAPETSDPTLAEAMSRIGEYVTAHQQQGDRGVDLIDEKVFDDNRGGWSGELYASDLRALLAALPAPETSDPTAAEVASRLSAAAEVADNDGDVVTRAILVDVAGAIKAAERHGRGPAVLAAVARALSGEATPDART